MPSAREDSRITVGNVQEWQRLCSNYKHATLASLQSEILANGLSHESDALLAHINQVCVLQTQIVTGVYDLF